MTSYRPIAAASSLSRVVLKTSASRLQAVPSQAWGSSHDNMEDIGQDSKRSKSWTKSTPILFAPHSLRDPLNKTWNPSMPILFKDADCHLPASISSSCMPLDLNDQIWNPSIPIVFNEPTAGSPCQSSEKHRYVPLDTDAVAQSAATNADCLARAAHRPVITSVEPHWAKLHTAQQKRTMAMWAPKPPKDRLPSLQPSTRSKTIGKNRVDRTGTDKKKRDEVARGRERKARAEEQRARELVRRRKEMEAELVQLGADWKSAMLQVSQQRVWSIKHPVEEVIANVRLIRKAIYRKIYEDHERNIKSPLKQTRDDIRKLLHPIRRRRKISTLELKALRLDPLLRDYKFKVKRAHMEAVIIVSERVYRDGGKPISETDASIHALDEALRRLIKKSQQHFRRGDEWIRQTWQTMSKFNFETLRELTREMFKEIPSIEHYSNYKITDQKLVEEFWKTDRSILSLLMATSQGSHWRLRNAFGSHVILWKSCLFVSSLERDLHYIRAIKRYSVNWKQYGAETRPSRIWEINDVMESSIRPLDILLESNYLPDLSPVTKKIKACRLQGRYIFQAVKNTLVILTRERYFGLFARNERQIRDNAHKINEDLRQLSRLEQRYRELGLFRVRSRFFLSDFSDFMRDMRNHSRHRSPRAASDRHRSLFAHGLRRQQFRYALAYLRTWDMDNVLHYVLEAAEKDITLDSTLLGFEPKIIKQLNTRQIKNVKTYIERKRDYLRAQFLRDPMPDFQWRDKIESYLRKMFPTYSPGRVRKASRVQLAAKADPVSRIPYTTPRPPSSRAYQSNGIDSVLRRVPSSKTKIDIKKASQVRSAAKKPPLMIPGAGKKLRRMKTPTASQRFQIIMDPTSSASQRFQIIMDPTSSPKPQIGMTPHEMSSSSHTIAFRPSRPLNQSQSSNLILKLDQPSRDTSGEDAAAANKCSEPAELVALAEVEAQYGQLRYRLCQDALDKHKAKTTDDTIYYSHRFYKDEDLKDVPVCYCKTFQRCEEVAEEFLSERVVGFDLEWRPNATAAMGIKNNVSLIQVSSRSRIALFHLALHKGKTAEEIMPPNLRKLIESADVIKTGVAISADCTRLKTFFGVEAHGLIELSHLHNLVHNRQTVGGIITRKLESLANQVKAHLQMPLAKGEVRVSEWHQALSFDQCAYAATDAWASLYLFYELEKRRQMLKPIPPMPSFAELKLPIIGARKIVVETDDEDSGISDDESSKESLGDEESSLWVTTDEEMSDEESNDDESSDEDFMTDEVLTEAKQSRPVRRLGRVLPQLSNTLDEDE